MLCYSLRNAQRKKGYVLNKRYIPFKNINTSHRIYRNPIAFEGRIRLDTSNDAKVNGDSIAGDSKWGTDTKKERALVRNVSSLCALSTCKGRLPTLPLSQYHRRDEA